MKLLIVAAIAALVFAPASALAGEAFLGVYAHDIDDGLSIGHTTEGGEQIIGGYRTGRIESLGWLARPQVHVLGAVNSRGGINYAAAGFDWRIPLEIRLYRRRGEADRAAEAFWKAASAAVHDR